jgi:diguanylate cyclase (GGDEF)-like protein
VRFSRLSLTTKLAAINMLLVASLIAVVAVAWRMLPAEQEAAADVAQLGRAQRANQNADMLHDALRSGVLRALLVGQVQGETSADVEQAIHSDASEFRTELNALAAMALPGPLQAQSAKAREAGAAYIALVDSSARLALTDRKAALAQMPEFSAAFERAKIELAQQTEQLAQALEAAHTHSREAAAHAQRWLVVAAALAIVVGWTCVALIAGSIRRSLTALRDVAREIAAGQLDRRSDRTGHDEVGQLAASVNQMAGNLQQMIDQMRSDAERGAYGSELVEAMDMADSEPQAYEVVARAMTQISPQHPMELLIADSSDAHLERAAAHPSAGAPGCGVESPFGCIAVRRGHALNFPNGEALNACPKLRGRPDGAVSAACVPVTFMGRALGVLHASSSIDQPLSALQFDRMTALGAQAGARIGTVRAFERTQLQASTDALTGLPNRRHVEQRLRELVAGAKPFVLVMADLDHFKRLNDTFGHQAGDEALRVFADVVRACTREHDLAGRWGGEEFGFLLAGASASEALRWTERVRERLAETLQGRSTPSFTASFGIADSATTRVPDALVRLADEALYRAKAEGRDRAALAGIAAFNDSIPRRDSEHDAKVDLRMLASAG